MDKEFLTKVCDYLVSLPFDLKVLQEAIADANLERPAREAAAGALMYALHPHEGSGPEAFLEDVFLLRAALSAVFDKGGDGAQPFQRRFPEVYEELDTDIALFQKNLGEDLWQWLNGRLDSYSKLPFKGKRAASYIDDEDSWDGLYDEGLAFQTNYSVTEAQVKNRLRRPEQIVQHLQKRHAQDVVKKRP